MKKIRFWLIKKLIANTPVIMNVTIIADESIGINGAEKDGIFEKWSVTIKEKADDVNDKPNNRNARRKDLRKKR
ncbi:MAG: hypothetical protein R3328_00065 [Planococcaceae bacterium]|nr:hypothetical protein [Planococcaceae bacterium]